MGGRGNYNYMKTTFIAILILIIALVIIANFSLEKQITACAEEKKFIIKEDNTDSYDLFVKNGILKQDLKGLKADWAEQQRIAGMYFQMLEDNLDPVYLEYLLLTEIDREYHINLK